MNCITRQNFRFPISALRLSLTHSRPKFGTATRLIIVDPHQVYNYKFNQTS